MVEWKPIFSTMNFISAASQKCNVMLSRIILTCQSINNKMNWSAKNQEFCWDAQLVQLIKPPFKHDWWALSHWKNYQLLHTNWIVLLSRFSAGSQHDWYLFIFFGLSRILDSQQISAPFFAYFRQLSTVKDNSQQFYWAFIKVLSTFQQLSNFLSTLITVLDMFTNILSILLWTFSAVRKSFSAKRRGFSAHGGCYSA